MIRVDPDAMLTTSQSFDAGFEVVEGHELSLGSDPRCPASRGDLRHHKPLGTIE